MAADTLGDVRFRIGKTPAAAGVDVDLLNAIINERLFEILRAFPWQSLRVDTILQTVVKYSTGTLAVTEGGTTLTGTSTVWTSGMTGRLIRIANRNELYTFTYVSATSATIDRAYEGDTETAATYSITKHIYTLPSDCSVIESLKVPESNIELDQIGMEELDQIAPARLDYGNPQLYALFEDDSSSTPLLQVELYPIPEVAMGLPLRYTKRVSRLSAAADVILPWISSECLIAGALAEITQQPFYEQRFQKLLSDMIREETRRMVPRQLESAARFTNHRRERLTGNISEEDRRRQMP